MINDSGIVVGVEHVQQLIDICIDNINKHHGNLLKDKKIIIEKADGRNGFKKYAPYKVIHVGAASPEIPKALIEQLDKNGRMFIPVGEQGKSQWIYLVDKDAFGRITKKTVMCVSYMPLTSAEIQLKNIRKK